MAVKYPGAIPTLDEIFKVTDYVDWIKAAEWNDMRAELRAALVELGTNPKGGFADVKTRFEGLAPKASPVFTGQATIPTINLTGGQIVFPAAQAASANANTLDDYEEGYHVVTVTCVGSGGYTLNAVKDTLAYTKVGRKVTIQGTIGVTGEDAPNGQLKFSLPFTVSALTEESDTFFVPVVISNHGDGGIENALIQIIDGNAFALLFNITDPGSFEVIDENRVDTSFDIYLNFSFIVQ